MKLLTDDEFFEGLIGGFASLIAFYFLKKLTHFKSNLIIGTLETWCIFWWIRKIGMNLYKQEKKYLGIRNSTFSINIPGESIHHHIFTNFFILFLIYFFILRHSKIPWKKITRLAHHDSLFLLVLLVMGWLVYRTETWYQF